MTCKADLDGDIRWGSDSKTMILLLPHDLAASSNNFTSTVSQPHCVAGITRALQKKMRMKMEGNSKPIVTQRMQFVDSG